MRLAISGGGALPDFLDTWIDAIGIRIVNAYGMTECAPTISGRALQCNTAFATLGAAANRAAAGASQSHAIIVSPMTGIVARRLAELGDMTTPGKPLFVIYEPGSLRVTALSGTAKPTGLPYYSDIDTTQALDIPGLTEWLHLPAGAPAEPDPADRPDAAGICRQARSYATLPGRHTGSPRR